MIDMRRFSKSWVPRRKESLTEDKSTPYIGNHTRNQLNLRSVLQHLPSTQRKYNTPYTKKEVKLKKLNKNEVVDFTVLFYLILLKISQGDVLWWAFTSVVVGAVQQNIYSFQSSTHGFSTFRNLDLSTHSFRFNAQGSANEQVQRKFLL
jgi:hypothetical protein